MFERLFSYPTVVRRHREGPLAAERAAYLEGLVTDGMALHTILRRASDCLHVAEELERWPPDHCFTIVEVEALATALAAARVDSGRASGPRWPEERFRSVAADFLQSLDRLITPSPPAGRYDDELADFIATQQEGRWSSAATCTVARWQITRFLDYLEQRKIPLANIVPSDVDAYFRHMAPRWGRNSLRTSAAMLRTWFRHCEKRKWSRAGLADAVLLPRIYQHEGLPLGPTWQQVGRMLSATAGDDVASLRDHAIILLLSVYGLRSGEVRRLRLDDIEWSRDRIRIVRSKSLREEILPIEARVGNAIARYLR
ncbi:MAG: tyrosine-type recombinase/integrase, partial [bacterium]|nr:tyrosine-type recombinase/integrase [bacterium]